MASATSPTPTLLGDLSGRMRTDLADDASAPFLTVLLRTQGHRLEPLRDALLSLAGQSDRDFDVVVVGHDVTADDATTINDMLDEFADLLPVPARFELVDGGTRSRPLNVGIAEARGEYLAVFDDDDLLFGHWVEAFHDAARRAPGRLLRAVCSTQQITPERWPHGEDGFRTLSWPKAEYAKTFDQLDHLAANRSPFMSVAFPRALFTVHGVAADEELVVCEDWDLILQGAFLLGVEDVPEMTAIYHRWQGGSSSYTRHDQAAWRASERRVLDRLNARPLLLEPGQVHRIRGMLGDEGAGPVLAGIEKSLSWRVTKPIRDARRRAQAEKARMRRAIARTLRGSRAGDPSAITAEGADRDESSASGSSGSVSDRASSDRD